MPGRSVVGRAMTRYPLRWRLSETAKLLLIIAAGWLLLLAVAP